MTRRYRYTLPKTWLPYAESRRDWPQMCVRSKPDHHEALHALAHKLNVSASMLARVIIGRVLEGETVTAENLIEERKDSSEYYF